MTLKRAAWWAMAGVLLRGAYYWTANMLPSWSAEIPADFRAQLVIVSTLDPLAWAAYFAMMATDRAPKIPAMLAVVFGLAQVGLSVFSSGDLFDWWQLKDYKTGKYSNRNWFQFTGVTDPQTVDFATFRNTLLTSSLDNTYNITMWDKTKIGRAHV